MTLKQAFLKSKNMTVRVLFSLLFLSIFCFTQIGCNGIRYRPKGEVVKIHQSDKIISADSVTVIAAKEYQAGLWKKMMQGKGYRKAWETPIAVPVVCLDTLYGGLTAKDKGGGEQTLSLELDDSLGNDYTLRSVNKNPESLIPPFAEKLNIEGIVTDGISAQHPYGSLVVGPMADALGLWHSNPQLIFVPSQPEVLDSFNQEFQDRMFFFEYETSGSGKWTKLPNICEVTSTEGMQELAHGDPYFHMDTANLVRARLFDLIIGDWDRHAKNWGWIITDEGETTLATVMACDRDNVFYGIGGIIPSIINRPSIQPLLRPFDKKIDHMPGYVKPFDSYFFYGVDKKLFEEQADFVKEHLTDEVMENALRTWPPQFYELDGEEILEKMKSRRDDIKKYAKEFHEIVQERGPLEEALKGSTAFGRMTGKKKRTKVN